MKISTLTKLRQLRPSSAGRWASCTASAVTLGKLELMGETPEDNRPMVYAEEGTRAHIVAANHLLGHDIPATVPPDMAQAAVDWRAGCSKNDVRYMGIEKQVPLFWLEGKQQFKNDWAHGTVDFWTLTKEDNWLTIQDLKYGKGVRVDAVGNEQLLIYAASVMMDDSIQPDGVTMRIFQPRIDGWKEWKLTRVEFYRELSRTVLSALDEIELGDVQFRPSRKACRFCPLYPCEAAQQDAIDISQEFLDLKPTGITTDQYAAFWKRRGDIQKAIEAAGNYLTEAAKRDPDQLQTLGLTLKEKTTHRRWDDRHYEEISNLLYDLLGWDGYQPITPKAALDLTTDLPETNKLKQLRSFIVKPKGQLTITDNQD